MSELSVDVNPSFVDLSQALLENGLVEWKKLTAGMSNVEKNTLLALKSLSQDQGNGTQSPSVMTPTLETPVQYDAQKAQSALSSMTLVLSLQLKQNDQLLDSSQLFLKDIANTQEILQKQTIEKMREAFEQQEKRDAMGPIMKALIGIASAFMIVAGAAMATTGAGAVAGGLMIALATDQLVSLARDKPSLMSQGTEALAVKLKEAGLGEPANAIVAAVITTALLIAVGGVAGVAASSAAKSSVTIFQKVGMSAERAAHAQSMANGVRSGAQMVSGASAAGAGTASIKAAVHQYDAQLATAQTTEFQALLQALSFRSEKEMEFIEEVLQIGLNTQKSAKNLIKTQSATNMTIGNHISSR